MGSRSVLMLLIVVFVGVLLYNALYFTGVVGGFDSSTSSTPRREPGFAIPGLGDRAPRPQPSAPRPPGQQPAAVGEARREVSREDLIVEPNWGRNPFLTPQEIRALENDRPVRQDIASTPITGLQLSAIVADSTGRRIAVIDNQIVSIGDVVAGMEIMEVWNDAVVFRLADGRRHVLRMADSAVGLTVQGGTPGR